MIPFFEDLLDRFHELFTDVEKAFVDLPQEALDWKPGLDMNSICVLIVHLTGSTRYWVGDVAMGDPSNRDREAEFHAGGLDANDLRGRLQDTEAYLQSAFEKLTLPDLESLRSSPRNNRQFTVAWALMHALEHTAIHLGHIQIMRQLWLQKEHSLG